MGEIIAALVMVMISLGPLPKSRNLDSTEKNLATVNFKKTAYDPAAIIWNSGPGLKKTTFSREGVTLIAFYDKHNDLLGTSRTVEISALSPIAINNLVEDFPGYQMGEIVEFTSSETIYFVTLKNNQKNFLVKINPDHQVSFFKDLE